MLVENANGDVEKAERGIIYVDEIDKITRKSENPSITRDVGGEGVQQALLKMVEGCEVEVPPQGGRKHPMQENIKVNTEKILFIVGGSFEGVDKTIKKREKEELVKKHGGKSSIGFNSFVFDPSTQDIKEFNDFITNVKAEDLRKFGMLPEFVGRFPVIAPLKELTEEDLVSILTEPENSLIKQYQTLLSYDGVELHFTKDALKEIAKMAIERKTGARSLRSVLEEILNEHMYTIPDEENIEKVTFGKNTIVNNEAPKITYHMPKALDSLKS